VTLIAFPVATSPSPDQNSNSLGQQLFETIGIGSVAIIALLGTLYLIRRDKKRTISPKKELINKPFIESEEEKILKIIRSSGGQIFQSVVTEQSRFSKAKASQLLTALEKKGVVTRYKKGRDKIVTLTEKGKDGSP
jgi:uncharacterized membrane protein